MTDKQKKDCDVKIRPMKPDDINAVIEIDQKISGPKRATTYDDPVTAEFGGELEFSVVAEKDNKVVGFIFGKHLYMGTPVSEVGLIQTLAVDPDHRRQGIASTLVDSLLELYRSKGLTNVRVMISTGDSQLERFFTQMDFSRGRLIDYTRAI
jgi:predicted N-acetyltransferase YhbS